jgi:DNA-binding transcriptional ArsR family regulator
MRRDVFQAIADPTRREIIHILAHGSVNVNAVAENFNISRPAISRHMKILTECGLVVIHDHGRERYCEANLRSLEEVSDWVDRYRIFWTEKLTALEKFLNRPDTAHGIRRNLTTKRKNEKRKKKKS